MLDVEDVFSIKMKDQALTSDEWTMWKSLECYETITYRKKGNVVSALGVEWKMWIFPQSLRFARR